METAVSSFRLPALPLAATVLVLLAGCGSESHDAPTADAAARAAPATTLARTADAVNPVASPRERVAEAMSRFVAAKSYHADLTTSSSRGDMTMQMDFVAPDRYRMAAPSGTQHVVGDTMYMTVNGRTMKMPLPRGQFADYRDPARLAAHQATMTVEPLGDDPVDGQPAQKYRIRNTAPQPGESTMWVGADGLPLRVEVAGGSGGQVARTTIRYSRFNDPAIRVDPP